MEIIDEHIERLVVGYLEHSLSSEEEAEFLEWLEADEEHMKHFLALKSVHNHRRIYVDIENGWISLLERIAAMRNSQKNKRIALWSSVAAAAVLALFAIGLHFNLVFTSGGAADSVNPCVFYTGSSIGRLTLPDGSTVKLAPFSHVSYGSDFGAKKRKVQLDGEAFFDVAKNARVPFVVEFGNQQIQVKGTKFNVSSYSRDRTSVATLVEGSILFQADNKKIRLKPGEQVSYDADEKSMQIVKLKDVSTEIDWLDKCYVFDSEPLSDILERMKNIYNVTFQCTNEKLMNTPYNVTFYDGESLKEFLQIIRKMTGLSYSIEGSNVRLS